MAGVLAPSIPIIAAISDAPVLAFSVTPMMLTFSRWPPTERLTVCPRQSAVPNSFFAPFSEMTITGREVSYSFSRKKRPVTNSWV